MFAEYYQFPPEEFHLHSPIQFNLVDSFESLCQIVARELVDLIRNNSNQGKMTKVVLPVGPLTSRISCEIMQSGGRELRVSCDFRYG